MCITQIHNSAHAFFQIWVYSITQLPRKLRCCLAATSLISQASQTTHLTDLCKSSLCLKKPTTQACSSVSRKENPEIRSPEAVPRASTRLSCLRKTPMRRLRFPDFQIVLMYTRRMTASPTTDLPTKEIWLPNDVARAPTRHLDFWLLLHAPVDLARAFHAPKHFC